METLAIGSVGPNVKLIQSLLNRIGYSADLWTDNLVHRQDRQ
jgi:peptidoglycan hydrolase-like protein with peptidoglycan-binding domain